MGNGNVKSNPYLSVKGAVINLMVPVFIKNMFMVIRWQCCLCDDEVHEVFLLPARWSEQRSHMARQPPLHVFKFQVYKFTCFQVYKFTSLQVFKFSLHSSVMRFYFYLHWTHCHQRRMGEIKIQTALSPFSISCPRKNLTQPSWF